MPGGWEPEEPATAPGQLREERLVEDYVRRMVPLRKGVGEMSLGRAMGAHAHLTGLLRDDPALFQALRALAEGHRGDVSREQMQALQKEESVTRSGQVRSDLKMMMKASYEEKGGKASIVDPFDMTNPNDAAAVIDWRERRARMSARAQALIKRWGEAEREREGRS